MNVVHEIAVERRRQIQSEGWSPEHDDTHRRGEMALAAACYAASSAGLPHVYGHTPGLRMERLWPWNRAWDKRHKHPRRRQLIIAAALIVAEIERLDRISAPQFHEPEGVQCIVECTICGTSFDVLAHGCPRCFPRDLEVVRHHEGKVVVRRTLPNGEVVEDLFEADQVDFQFTPDQCVDVPKWGSRW